MGQPRFARFARMMMLGSLAVAMAACGAAADDSAASTSLSPGTPVELGTAAQAISSSFNGCTYTTFVPERVAPSIYPEWNEDVRAFGSIQCDTAGSYNVLHNLQVWNAQWQSWDGYHFWDPTIYSLAAGSTMNFENRNWLEPFCYRASMAIQKFDANHTLIWTSPTIYSGAINLGQACPGTCVPTTCAELGKNCGSVSDGCGGTLSCGTCATGSTCGGGGTANVCGIAPALTLTVTGRSGEKVTSTPAGLSVNVGTTGTANFNAGTSVKLTASNGRSAIWSGACSSAGAKTASCTFTLTANSSVTANIQ
jgi:hypothetical protein